MYFILVNKYVGCLNFVYVHYIVQNGYAARHRHSHSYLARCKNGLVIPDTAEGFKTTLLVELITASLPASMILRIAGNGSGRPDINLEN